MSWELPILKFPLVALALHFLLGELLTKYVWLAHDGFAATYGTVVSAFAVITIRPPAALKKTAKILVGAANVAVCTLPESKTATDTSDSDGTNTKIGYPETTNSASCPARKVTEPWPFPSILHGDRGHRRGAAFWQVGALSVVSALCC
jgi:hypothetical protein